MKSKLFIFTLWSTALMLMIFDLKGVNHIAFFANAEMGGWFQSMPVVAIAVATIIPVGLGCLGVAVFQYLDHAGYLGMSLRSVQRSEQEVFASTMRFSIAAVVIGIIALLVIGASVSGLRNLGWSGSVVALFSLVLVCLGGFLASRTFSAQRSGDKGHFA